MPLAMGAFFSCGNRSICSSKDKPCAVFLPTAFSRADMCAFFLFASTVDPCNAAPRLLEKVKPWGCPGPLSGLVSDNPTEAAANIARKAAAASSSPGCRCVKSLGSTSTVEIATLDSPGPSRPGGGAYMNVRVDAAALVSPPRARAKSSSSRSLRS